MNRPPNPMQPHRPLAEILQDPDTEWADIREAMKTQGRGSFMMGNQPMAATTNMGIVTALRESVSSEMIVRVSSCILVTSDEEDYDEIDQIVSKKKLTKELKPAEFKCSLGEIEENLTHHEDEVGGANKESDDNSRAPKSAHHNVGSSNIKEVTFTDSAEQKTMGELSFCAQILS